MNKITFRAKISKQGSGRVIYIPKEYLADVEELEGQYIDVTLEET